MKWTAQFIVTVFCVVASNRKTTHPREGASRIIHTMNLQYVAVITDSQLVVLHTPSRFYLHGADHVLLYYTKHREYTIYALRGSVVCCQASITLLREGGKEKA